MTFSNFLPSIVALRAYSAASQASLADIRGTLAVYGESLNLAGYSASPVHDLMGLMKMAQLRPADGPYAAQAAEAYLGSRGLFPISQHEETGYETRLSLGRGCFSEVFLAQELATGRDVALKIHLPPFREAREGDVPFRGIFNELRFQASVDGDAIVRVLRCGLTLGATPFLALEYLPGGTVQDAIRDSMNPFELADLVLLSAAVLHDSGILHGDIAIQNLLLSADRKRVKLGDFAMARRTTDRPYNFETLSRKDGKSEGLGYDVFQLGKVLYQIFTRYPEDISDINVQQAVAPSRKRPDLDLPSWIDEFIARAIHPDLNHRFPDATAMYAAFRARSW